MEGESAESNSKMNWGAAKQEAVVGGNKPLHRFLRIQPKFIGTVLVFFGCNEMMMGFTLIHDIKTSATIYIPFWQAALLAICGSLSIHSHSYPSKKLVTVCLAMYIVTILGGFVSVFFRLVLLLGLSFHYDAYYAQLISTEALLLTSTLLVIVLLIILCSYANASLRSSNTQVIFRQQHLTITDMDNNGE
ncbi:hypothetical protein ACEWY4_027248 [Coilia grayii]|uniref:Uncharacterized protein n=1 Tax=Coilia grayii TaxID=363190 RepID=A0ABD1IRW3_9TELE